MPFQTTYLFVVRDRSSRSRVFVVLPLREKARPARRRRVARGARNVGRELVAFVRDAWRAFTGSRAALVGVLYALLPAGAYALSLALQSNLAVELGLNDNEVAQLNLLSTRDLRAGLHPRRLALGPLRPALDARALRLPHRRADALARLDDVAGRLDHAGRHEDAEPAAAVDRPARHVLGGVHRLQRLPGPVLRHPQRALHGHHDAGGRGDAVHRLHGADEPVHLVHRVVAGLRGRADRLSGDAGRRLGVRPGRPAAAAADAAAGRRRAGAARWPPAPSRRDHGRARSTSRPGVGRSETRSDAITAAPLAALAATLDRDDPPPAPRQRGAAALALAATSCRWRARASSAPTAIRAAAASCRRCALPRRMWAGGRLAFAQAAARRRGRDAALAIADVASKSARSGPLVFVTVRHEISTPTAPSRSARSTTSSTATCRRRAAPRRRRRPRRATRRSRARSCPTTCCCSAIRRSPSTATASTTTAATSPRSRATRA